MEAKEKTKNSLVQFAFVDTHIQLRLLGSDLKDKLFAPLWSIADLGNHRRIDGLISDFVVCNELL